MAGGLIRKICAVTLVVLTALLASCASPQRPTLDSHNSISKHDSGAHQSRGRFLNIGMFSSSRGGKWIKLAVDPYRNRMVLPPNHALNQDEAAERLFGLNAPLETITWIGHSTFLIRVGNQWVLTDPIFSDYATPTPPFGPKRLVPPGLKIEDLPPIDVILLSHNHYDHTDTPTLRRLARRNPNTKVFVPLNNARVPRKAGFHSVFETDWFQTHSVGRLNLTAVPAVHSSRRRLSDLNHSLWGGWSISAGGKKIYFAGDTAAGSFVHDIRRRLGRHHLALVPIGAYSPEDVEKGHHATPEESVEMARNLGAYDVVPMHWGTFALSGEPISEQRDRFLAASRQGVRPHLLRIGETIALP